MFEKEYNVHRLIAVYSNKTEEILVEYKLLSFELESFQKEFSIRDKQNPMFECYPIHKNNISFIEQFIGYKIDWDFEGNSYFLEANQI